MVYMTNQAKGYQDLVAWQEGVALATDVFSLTRSFSRLEGRTIADQMLRSVVSISSNIAEGYRRQNMPEFRNFLRYAYASAAELETQLVIAKQNGLGENLMYEQLLGRIDRVQALLYGLIRSGRFNPKSVSRER